MFRFAVACCVLCNFIPSTVTLSPNGANVCMRNETFITTVLVTEPYQVQVRYTEWCFSVPPRCSRYKTVWRSKNVQKEVENWRMVPTCCYGFVSLPSENDCRPYCSPRCRQGQCIKPNTCECEPGYRGATCEKTCEQGFWGKNCSNPCECAHASFCYHTTGKCHCSSGWIGERCEQPCLEGFHGPGCLQECDCQGFKCHHITAECFIPTTEPSTTPEVSTTEISTSTTEVSTSTTEVSTSTTEVSTSTTEVSTSTTEVSTGTTEISTSLIDVTSTTEESTTVTTSGTMSISESTTVTDGSSMETSSILDSGITIPTTNSNVTNEHEEKRRNEIAKFIATVALSIFGAIVLLLAAAGLAIARHRKVIPDQPTRNSSDFGLYKIYGETTTLPVKTLFHNPTYDCGEVNLEKPNLQTFKAVNDSFELGIRDLLEAHYDHPPRTDRSSSIEHLYDEIASAVEETRFSTFFSR